MPDGVGPPTPLAIIAGRGTLPRQIADHRAEAGLPYVLIVFPGCYEEWMADHPHERHEFERVGQLFQALRAARATHVVFAGAMNRPKLRIWRMDLKGLRVLLRALTLLRRGDDAMLRGFAGIFEEEGLKLIGPHEILGEATTIAAGPLGSRLPTMADKKDAARAAQIVGALGPLDVGQGAVVAHGLCLAVEAIEGTDLMLARLIQLPVERRAAALPPCGVLFKGPKPNQDRRLDMPTVGRTTVRGAAAAGLNGIVAAAGETLLLDEEETRRIAEEAGVFVYGATSDELASWGS